MTRAQINQLFLICGKAIALENALKNRKNLTRREIHVHDCLVQAVRCLTEATREVE